MADRIKDIVVGVVLALLAYLKPIEGELSSLMIVFTLNFIFGYLSGMIAKGENFELKKAVVCIGHATVFFVLCAAVYAIGRFKGQMEGSVQCVSFISYLVLWFYGCNILEEERLAAEFDLTTLCYAEHIAIYSVCLELKDLADLTDGYHKTIPDYFYKKRVF